MRSWIVVAALFGCSTPKGLAPLDSGEEPPEEDASEEEEDDNNEDDADADNPETDSDADVTPVAGEPCIDVAGAAGIWDCELTCWADMGGFIGDGECDDGFRGPNFFCETFDYDGGDCLEGGGGTTDGSDAPTTGGSTDGSGTTTDGGDSTDGSGTTTGGSGTATGGGTTTGGSGTTTGGSGTTTGGTSGGSTSGGGTTSGGTTTGAGDDDVSEFASWTDGVCEAAILLEGDAHYVSDETDFFSSGADVESTCTMFGHRDSVDDEYRWIPSTGGVFCLSTAGSMTHLALSVWSGDCSAERLCVSDDVVEDPMMEFSASPGEEYMVVIDGYSHGDDGPYTLTITPGACP